MTSTAKKPDKPTPPVATDKTDRSWLPLLSLVMVIGTALHCGETPTEPATPNPIPTAVPLDLSGEWNGTLENLGCSAPAQINARLIHQGNDVQGTLRLGCPGEPEFPGGGDLDLRGVLHGPGGAARVELRWNEQWVCTLFGEAHPTSIFLSNPYRNTNGSWSSNLCRGAQLSLSR